jgi:hypothetical protein
MLDDMTKIRRLLSDRDFLWRASFVFAILLIVSSGLLWFTTRGYPDRPAPADFYGPILSVELAKTPEDLQWALGDCDLKNGPRIHSIVFWNTVVDLLFIPCYAGFVTAFSGFLATRLKPMQWAANVPRDLIVFAALTDFVEDGGIFYALNHTDSGIFWIAIPSLVKWTLLYLSILSLGILFLAVKDAPFAQPLTGIVTLLVLASGVVGLLGWIAPLHYQHGAELFAVLPLARALWPLLQRLQP